MFDEEIKKEIQALAEDDLNKGYLEDLAKFNEYYSKHLYLESNFDKVIEEIGDDIGAQADAYDDIERFKNLAETKSHKIQKTYGLFIGRQVQTFFEGPEDASDEKVSQWVKDNYLLVRLLACSRMPESLEKIKSSSELFALCSFVKKMPAAVNMAKSFMLKYHKEAVVDNDKQPQLNEEDYQHLMQENLKDLKDQQAKLDETEKSSLNNTKTVLAESGNYYADNKKKFDKFAENLEKAKTYRNSKEYELLIKWVKHFNQSEDYVVAKGDTFQGTRTDLQNYAMKLFAIKSVINNYLDHKARDGVKKNTFEKLAAVEELNSFVSQELEKYKPDYNKRENAYRDGKEKALVKCTYTAWRENFDKVPEGQAMPDKQRAALNCMGRIIAKAEQQHLEKEKIKDLKAMHTAFGGAAAQKAPEEKAMPKTL